MAALESPSTPSRVRQYLAPGLSEPRYFSLWLPNVPTWPMPAIHPSLPRASPVPSARPPPGSLRCVPVTSPDCSRHGQNVHGPRLLHLRPHAAHRITSRPFPCHAVFSTPATSTVSRATTHTTIVAILFFVYEYDHAALRVTPLFAPPKCKSRRFHSTSRASHSSSRNHRPSHPEPCLPILHI